MNWTKRRFQGIWTPSLKSECFAKGPSDCFPSEGLTSGTSLLVFSSIEIYRQFVGVGMDETISNTIRLPKFLIEIFSICGTCWRRKFVQPLEKQNYQPACTVFYLSISIIHLHVILQTRWVSHGKRLIRSCKLLFDFNSSILNSWVSDCSNVLELNTLYKLDGFGCSYLRWWVRHGITTANCNASEQESMSSEQWMTASETTTCIPVFIQEIGQK